MYMSYLFNYYRLGRLIFAMALFIAFQVAGFASGTPQLMYTIGIYTLIAMLRLIVSTEKINYFDFFLDIVFISSIIYISFGVYSYLTILYLFPIFFSSVLIKTKRIFLFPLLSIILYGTIYFVSNTISDKENILNLVLHFLSFSLIAFAGDNLKERMENQERYIKRLEEEKIRMQGYERLYRVSADLAHELRNPLTSISASIQFMKEGKSGSDYIDMLETETRRITMLINDFLLFSRPSDAPREDVDMEEILRGLCSVTDTGKTITVNVHDNAVITANRTFMEAALNNIIKNAAEAAHSMVRVSLGRSNELCEVYIEDDGPGLDDEMRDKIFEPFFTTKTTGTGLGLAISYRVVNSFGGNILVDKSSLGGVRFTVILPCNTGIRSQ